MCPIKRLIKKNPVFFLLLSITVYAGMSYAQIGNLSAVRNVGANEQVLDLTISLPPPVERNRH